MARPLSVNRGPPRTTKKEMPQTNTSGSRMTLEEGFKGQTLKLAMCPSLHAPNGQEGKSNSAHAR